MFLPDIYFYDVHRDQIFKYSSLHEKSRNINEYFHLVKIGVDTPSKKKNTNHAIKNFSIRGRISIKISYLDISKYIEM